MQAIHEDLTCENYEEVLHEFFNTGRNINEIMQGKLKSGWAQVQQLIAKHVRSTNVTYFAPKIFHVY